MEDVETILPEYLSKVNATTPLDPYSSNLLEGFEEYTYLVNRYESTMDIYDLYKAIEIVREAITTTPLSDKQWASQLNDLGSQVFDRASKDEAQMDLGEAIYALQRIIDIMTPNCPHYAITTGNLGFLLHSRFSKTRDVPDLDKAISKVQDILDITPSNHLDWPKFLSILQDWLHERYECTKDGADIEEIICLGQSLINATPLDHPERATRLMRLAIYFHKRHSSMKDIGDLDAAISLAQEANETNPLADPVWVKTECARWLGDKYGISRNAADLEECIFMFFEAAEICPTDDRRWSGTLHDLAAALNVRYVCLCDKALADVNNAVMIHREAIATLPLDYTERDTILANLGVPLFNRYRHTGATSDLDEAINIVRDAVYTSSAAYESRLQESINLACYLNDRYYRTRSQPDIEECICLLQEAYRSTPKDHPQRTAISVNLVGHLCRKYEHTGVPVTIDEAINIARASLDDNLPDFHQARILQLHNLGSCLYLRYYHIGAMADLEDCISLSRKAVESMPPNFTGEYGFTTCSRNLLLSGLGLALSARYDRTNAIENLNEAISFIQEALETIPLGSIYQERSSQLHNLSHALSKRFNHSGEIADLMEAISMLKEAVDITPVNDLMRVGLLSSLGTRLYLKYGHTGTKADLDEAIYVCQDAADAIPSDHPNRAFHLNVLGALLTTRFSRAKTAAYVMKARNWTDPVSFTIECFKSMTALFPYYGALPKWSDVEPYLCGEYSLTEIETQALLDMENARRCFTDALYHTTAKASDRFKAGQEILETFDFINHEKAYEIAKDTVNLIPLLMSSSLQNSDRQRILSGAGTTALDAAAIALHALPSNRRTLAAIECLETGRGLIGKTLFEQHEVSSLKKCHPDLANSFLTLRDRLARPITQDVLNILAPNREVKGDNHHKTDQEFAGILETIRSKPAFQRFLLPALESDMLHAAACGGPIVILNWSQHRFDALIIEQSGLRVLEFPRLSQGILSYHQIGKSSTNLESLETLAWLWDDIVSPVLDALGFTETPTDDSWPHVWWIPTGIMTKFPLHAAGHHLRGNGHTTLDRVVSSYATSVKSIIHSRRWGISTTTEPMNVVAVAMEETNGHAPLIYAGHEIDAISTILESKKVHCNRPQPYKYEVLSAMKTCQIFHFAGHGETHLTDPLRSALLLMDWKNEPLTVASLLETDLSSNSPFLAYLSACGTSQSLDRGSNEEGIHLANAFQLAGFRHVIGTLWSVNDELCVEIAEITYKALKEGMRDDLVSRGLHDAIRMLRDRWVVNAIGGDGNESRAVYEMRGARHAQLDDDEELGQPLWIPYVHFGV